MAKPPSKFAFTKKKKGPPVKGSGKKKAMPPAFLKKKGK